MKSGFILFRVITASMLFFGSIGSVIAQPAQDTLLKQDLYKEIARMDSILFNAFNTRNIDQFKALFTPDLEFYHDKSGLTGYENTINFIKATTQSDNQLRRDLVKGSLEVYPIPGYGAIQTGEHIFCHKEKGKKDCGGFKFVHIWKKEKGEWKISRIVSYGH